MQSRSSLLEKMERGKEDFNVYIYNASYDSKFRCLKPHWHEELEIWYCDCGGNCMLDDVSISFRKGTIFFVNRKEVHAREMTSPGSIYSILVDYKSLAFAREDDCQKRILSPLYDETHYITSVLEEGTEMYQEIHGYVMDLIAWRNYTEGFFHHLRVKANLYSILAILYENGSIMPYDEAEKLKRTKVATMQSSINYMEEHISENITVEELAEVSNLSKYHYMRRFKDMTTYTPVQYLTNMRIEYAKELLQKHDVTIDEIAFATGFHHISYFTKVFKKGTDMTPTEYRKKYQ
ncbi:MAG: AraC family transcriptional regulator [Lachnospiraceae bacterium]